MCATGGLKHAEIRVAQVISRIRVRHTKTPITVATRFRNTDGAVGRRDRATHWIHWYPAKMFHRIPAEILDSFERGPLAVLDPFCGSGTVLLEAAMRGHRAIGADVNPLARLLSRVKTRRLDGATVCDEAVGIAHRAATGTATTDVDRLPGYWFLPAARHALVRTNQEIQRTSHGSRRDFLRICLSAIVRPCSLADPSVPPPVRLSTKRAQRAGSRYTRDLERALAVTADTVREAFCERVQSNVQRMSELQGVRGYGRVRILDEDAEAAATGLPSQSVDVIITSPPYCGAQKYVRSLKLEMMLLGFARRDIDATDRRTLGTERLSVRHAARRLATPLQETDSLVKAIAERNTTRAVMVAEYVRYLERFAAECARVLKRRGEAFVTFGRGHVAGIPVAWDGVFASLARRAGLRLEAVLVDRIPSRGLMTSRHRSSGVIDDERVVWLRKG